MAEALPPELQQIARQLLAIAQPVLQAAASYAANADGGDTGKCQQVWCPVCAAVAVASGEQHPLAALIAEHGAGLLAMLQAMLTPDPPGSPTEAPPATDPGRYQPIAVTIVDDAPRASVEASDERTPT